MSEEKKVVVIYNKANTLNLPYSIGEGKQRKVKYHKFVPGKQELSESIWNAICAEAGDDRMANHSRYMKVADVSVDEETGKLNFDSCKNAEELIEVIENIMGLEELAEAKEYEENGKKRKTVLCAIDKQAEAIQSMIDKIEKNDED